MGALELFPRRSFNRFLSALSLYSVAKAKVERTSTTWTIKVSHLRGDQMLLMNATFLNSMSPQSWLATVLEISWSLFLLVHLWTPCNSNSRSNHNKLSDHVMPLSQVRFWHNFKGSFLKFLWPWSLSLLQYPVVVIWFLPNFLASSQIQQ